VRHTAVSTVLVGALLGVLVTISSVGAGALGVTALLLLYPRLPMAVIVGSDIAHAVPLTLLAGIGHWYLGAVDWTLLTSLLTGSVPGIIVGRDPLTDLGLLVMYSIPLGSAESPVSTTAEAAGHPDPAELVERYAARSGRDVSGIYWYTAFAWFKLAVILEGIHYRYTLGQTVGRGFDRIGDLVPVFIEHGLTTLQEG